MRGAIAGDMIGSIYEGHPPRGEAYPLIGPGSRFTDDSVLTVAVADAILRRRSYQTSLIEWARRFPRAGYGGRFRLWASAWEPTPYGSIGNGSAMRVSPVGWAFNNVRQVLAEARRSAEVTHNSPIGIAGAQMVALAVYMARKGQDRERIRKTILARFGCDLRKPGSPGSAHCALGAWYRARSWEDTIRKAIRTGVDCDTMAAIAGSVAEACWPVPADVWKQVEERLDSEIVEVVRRFRKRWIRTAETD